MDSSRNALVLWFQLRWIKMEEIPDKDGVCPFFVFVLWVFTEYI